MNEEFDQFVLQTELMLAIHKNDVEQFKALAGRCKSVSFVLDHWEHAPLGHAARLGYFEIVKLLVERYKADVCGRKMGRMNPISLALSTENNEIAKYLVEHGAALDVRHGGMLRDLTVSQGKCTPMIYVRSPEMVHYLIEHGIYQQSDRNFPSNDTKVLLERGELEIAETLISAGYQEYFEDRDGLSVLHMALKHPHASVDFIRLLLYIGNKVNHKDGFGCTPLNHAVASQNLEAIEYLLSVGADPSKIEYRQTAIQECLEKHPHIRELLLRKRIELESQEMSR